MDQKEDIFLGCQPGAKVQVKRKFSVLQIPS